jgi:hypothetical protein
MINLLSLIRHQGPGWTSEQKISWLCLFKSNPASRHMNTMCLSGWSHPRRLAILVSRTKPDTLTKAANVVCYWVRALIRFWVWQGRQLYCQSLEYFTQITLLMKLLCTYFLGTVSWDIGLYCLRTWKVYMKIMLLHDHLLIRSLWWKIKTCFFALWKYEIAEKHKLLSRKAEAPGPPSAARMSKLTFADFLY